jgi:hypothetical protein
MATKSRSLPMLPLFVNQRAAVFLTVVVVSVVWGLLHVGWYSHQRSSDVGVYKRYGYAVVTQHRVPYRDVSLEYPPGALPVFVIPAVVRWSGYAKVFQGLVFACLAATALAVLASAGTRAALATAVAPLALGALVTSRFDLWPTALTALSLAALLRRHFTASAVLLATAFAAKLWPAILAPLILIWLARVTGWRPAVRWMSVAAATAAAWFLPFVVLSADGIGHSFYRQLGRPLQVESLAGAVLVAVHDVWHIPLGTSTSFGSSNVGGGAASAAATATTVVEALALIAVYVAFVRTQATAADLLRHSAAAVAVAIAFGKVFSPQFLIWLFPLVPLVRGRRGVIATVGLFVACVLTQLYYPHHFKDYSAYFYARPTLDVLIRNLIVVALAITLAWPTTRARARAYPTGSRASA